MKIESKSCISKQGEAPETTRAYSCMIGLASDKVTKQEVGLLSRVDSIHVTEHPFFAFRFSCLEFLGRLSRQEI